MISVSFKIAKKLSLTVKGHAGGEKDHDLVCASASILAYTLAQNLKDNKMVCDKVRTHMKPGDTTISCTPKDGYWNALKILFHTIVRGYEVLSENYPDKVSVQRIIPKHK